MDNQNKKNQDPKKNNRQGFSFVILVTLITTILVLALYQFQGQGSETEISYDKFLKYVDAELSRTISCLTNCIKRM